MSQLKYDNLSAQDKKLLLLTVLGISPERILQLQRGDILLSDVLSERIREVMSDPNDTTQCAIVCQNIRQDGDSYETLEPDKYLEHINGMKAGGGRFADDVAPAPAIEAETVREDGFAAFAAGIYPRPVLRFFARFLDLLIYLVFFNVLCRSILGFNPFNYGNTRVLSIWIFFIYLVMIALEAVWIHLLGTTPGKWITGVRITDLNGQKLSWKASFRRSFLLFRFGLGFNIPFLNLFRRIYSFSVCRSGMLLPWDAGTKIDRPQQSIGARIALLIIAFFVLSEADAIGKLYLELPKNRGAITEQEFFDNCARIVKYDSITFEDVPEYVVSLDKDGHVESVTFTLEYTNEDKQEYIYSHYNEMYVAFLALAGAGKEYNPVAFRYGTVSQSLFDFYTDHEFDYAGVKVINETEYSGYARNILSDYLYRLPDGDAYFKQTFTVKVK